MEGEDLQCGLADQHSVLRVPDHQLLVVSHGGKESLARGHVRGQAVHRPSVEEQQV